MRILWPVARLIARNSTFLIVSGIRAKKFWDFVGIPRDKTKIVHFDVSILEPEEKHVKLSNEIRGTHSNKKIILYFGRLEKRKGIDFLIRAFGKFCWENEDVVLLIAGEGEARGSLQELCKEIGVDNRVHFASFVNEGDKAAYFLACDVFVCPSITLDMPEIWGLVVNEAMSIGKPIVATTAVGSAYDLVKHHLNGYVVPEKNVNALYEAIKTIISDEKLRANMGTASQDIIKQKFTYYHALEGFNEAIESALLRARVHVKR